MTVAWLPLLQKYCLPLVNDVGFAFLAWHSFASRRLLRYSPPPLLLTHHPVIPAFHLISPVGRYLHRLTSPRFAAARRQSQASSDSAHNSFDSLSEPPTSPATNLPFFSSTRSLRCCIQEASVHHVRRFVTPQRGATAHQGSHRLGSALFFQHRTAYSHSAHSHSVWSSWPLILFVDLSILLR